MAEDRITKWLTELSGVTDWKDEPFSKEDRDAVIENLRKAWDMYPTQRFTQLLTNIFYDELKTDDSGAVVPARFYNLDLKSVHVYINKLTGEVNK